MSGIPGLPPLREDTTHVNSYVREGKPVAGYDRILAALKQLADSSHTTSEVTVPSTVRPGTRARVTLAPTKTDAGLPIFNVADAVPRQIGGTSETARALSTDPRDKGTDARSGVLDTPNYPGGTRSYDSFAPGPTRANDPRRPEAAPGIARKEKITYYTDEELQAITSRGSGPLVKQAERELKKRRAQDEKARAHMRVPFKGSVGPKR